MEGWSNGVVEWWSGGEKVENELINLIKSLENKRNKGDWIDYMVKEEWTEYGGVE